MEVMVLQCAVHAGCWRRLGKARSHLGVACVTDTLGLQATQPAQQPGSQAVQVQGEGKAVPAESCLTYVQTGPAAEPTMVPGAQATSGSLNTAAFTVEAEVCAAAASLISCNIPYWPILLLCPSHLCPAVEST